MLKKLANQQGNTKARLDACNRLFDAYWTGDGVEKDEEEAVKWLTKAAEMNDALAQGTLGACYYEGRC